MAIINKETIISAFDDKMTLLQWLKKLEKVLDKSTLASINTIKVANTQYKIVLSFEDGTTIESDIIQLQSEIAGIHLQNGHLIFTLINGETLDAGLIDVSNLGNTTIYGTFEVADGNATFGGNVEVDGTLKVNSTLQVGDTTTNDDELAKLPRTLLTPLDTPTEQKLVGIDTANGQNLLELGEGLQIENDKIKVGGTITDAEVIEPMAGYSFSKNTTPSGFSIDYKYASIVKNGNKLTAVTYTTLTALQDIAPYSLSIRIGSFGIPENIGEKLYPATQGQFNDVLCVEKPIIQFTTDTYQTQSGTCIYRKVSNKTFIIWFYNDTTILSNQSVTIRTEITFLLSDSLVG